MVGVTGQVIIFLASTSLCSVTILALHVVILQLASGTDYFIECIIS